MDLIEDKGVITRKEYEKLDPDERLNYWQIKRNSYKLISELDDEHLQNAFCYAQTKELEFHNKYGIFFELVARLQEEGDNRKLELKDLDTEFHRKKRILR